MHYTICIFYRDNKLPDAGDVVDAMFESTGWLVWYLQFSDHI